MVQINFALREVNCKIVYYGPGMSGKTTNLEIVHKKAPQDNKGELTSIATEGDRTLFFDFMPLDLGNVAGMRTKFQLYTVPGQVYYNSTRKLVLQGADGVIFVADSSRSKMKDNLESWNNLVENLDEYGKDIKDVPVVLQWNKRDLPDAMDTPELEEKMNPLGVPTFEAVAITGEGVFPTLKALSAMVLESLNRGGGSPGTEAAAAQPAGAPAPAAMASSGGASAPPTRISRPVGGSSQSAPAAGGLSAPNLPPPRGPARQAPELRQGRGGGTPAAGRPRPAPRPRPQQPPKQPVAARPQTSSTALKKKGNGVVWIVAVLLLLGAAAAGYMFRNELGLEFLNF